MAYLRRLVGPALSLVALLGLWAPFRRLTIHDVQGGTLDVTWTGSAEARGEHGRAIRSFVGADGVRRSTSPHWFGLPPERVLGVAFALMVIGLVGSVVAGLAAGAVRRRWAFAMLSALGGAAAILVFVGDRRFTADLVESSASGAVRSVWGLWLVLGALVALALGYAVAAIRGGRGRPDRPLVAPAPAVEAVRDGV
jgi:hypothetical protein